MVTRAPKYGGYQALSGYRNIVMNEPVVIASDTISALNIATVTAAIIVMIVVVFYAMITIRQVKSEFAKIKEALGKVASGTYKEALPVGNYKESAELFAYITRLAENLQKQREAITVLAFSDHLTGLANRMRFEDELARGFNFARRGLPICVVRANITAFDEINDRLGRETGDHALKVTATSIRQAVRKTDVAARLDADDFALILPNMDPAKIVDWLRQLDNRYVQTQRQDARLHDIEPRVLRFGYSFIKTETDKDFHDVWARANDALAKAVDPTQTAIVGG